MSALWFAARLHVGQDTVSRWVSGWKVQRRAMDLLRAVLRDVTGALADHGRQLP